MKDQYLHPHYTMLMLVIFAFDSFLAQFSVLLICLSTDVSQHFFLQHACICMQEVQVEMACKKKALSGKLAELQAHNAELRQRFQQSAQPA